VTGWEEGEAEGAAIELFKHWLNNRETSGSADDEAIVRQVRAFIEAHGSSRFESADTERVANRVGFKATTSNGEIEYCFFTEQFKRDVCAGFDPQRAARVLRDRGYLVTSGDKDLTVKRSVRDEGRPRVYVVKETILESGRSGRSGASE